MLPNWPRLSDESGAPAVAADGLPPPPAVTAEMVREALAHCPLALVGHDRFVWIAARLDRAIREPNHVCPCCGVSLSGEHWDESHPLNQPQQGREWRLMPAALTPELREAMDRVDAANYNSAETVWAELFEAAPTGPVPQAMREGIG